MKTTLEPDDVKAIASEVVEMLRPMLSGNGKADAIDKVFDKRGLSEYLLISSSTISKMIVNKEIPYFKIQPGQSGGVRFYKRDIDRWISKQTMPETGRFRP